MKLCMDSLQKNVIMPVLVHTCSLSIRHYKYCLWYICLYEWLICTVNVDEYTFFVFGCMKVKPTKMMVVLNLCQCCRPLWCVSIQPLLQCQGFQSETDPSN